MFTARAFSWVLLLSIFSFSLDGVHSLSPTEQRNAPMLTFNDLKNHSTHQDQVVTIRGFLYQTQGGDWVLAEEPNLKTCCVGSAKKIDRQIFVSGEFGNPERVLAVTLQGRFDAKPTMDSKGNIKKLYHITEAKLIDEPNHSWSKLLFVFVTTGLTMLVFGVVLLRNSPSRK
ncbi:MAG: hypothetical protein K940chlam7_00019 [Chlamydiae bacterium]|nr:hypothetical protein [Chlamydiota bacterium]